MKIAYAGVIILWVVTMSMIAVRHYGPGAETAPSAALTDLSQALFGEEWMGVYHKGRKIGYSRRKMERNEGGYRISETLVMKLNVMNSVKEVRTDTEVYLDSTMNLISFTFFLDADAGMKVAGQIVDKTLRLILESAGTRTERTIPLKEQPSLQIALVPALLKEGVAPGRKFSLPVIDPATLNQGRMTLEVEGKENIPVMGEEKEAFRIKGHLGGVEFSVWITEDGQVLREESPLGFVLVREKKEDALSIAGYSSDLIVDASIPFNLKLPGNVRYLRVRIAGTDLHDLELHGGRQALRGRVLEIRKEHLADRTQTIGTTIPDGSLDDSFFVQSKDPRILAQSQEIVAGEKDRLKAARLISSWVYENIEKVPSITVPVSTDVLRTREGDCNEHTVLFTALSRAAGIPARIALGLVYKDGSFYYHAWPEVFDGRWIAVDPTLGQFPADAAHIRLITGDLDQQYRIVPVIGKITLEGLEFE